MLTTSHIGSKRFPCFDSPYFEVNGRKYTIVSTTKTGRGYYDSIDTVKNDKGEYREFSRRDLIKFVNQE